MPEGAGWLTVKRGPSSLSLPRRAVFGGRGQHGGGGRPRLDWPSGHNEELGSLPAGRTYTVEEGKGIIADIPFEKSR